MKEENSSLNPEKNRGNTEVDLERTDNFILKKKNSLRQNEYATTARTSEGETEKPIGI